MKPNFMSRSLLAVILLGGAALSAEAQKYSSAHWKSKTVMEGASSGDVTAESEIWMKNEKMRVKMQSRGMVNNMVMADDAIYQWVEGQSTGMKMAKSPESGKATPDYVKMDIRANGKKTGTETIDGHPCDIYVMETNQGGQKAKHTAWLAKDRSGFPAKWVVETANSKTTTTNRDIEVPGNVTDAMIAPPKDVRFQDMSEMMKNMPRH
jgi:hypothetical protein